MIPATQNNLDQTFEIQTLPGRTFKMHHDTLTITGTIDEVEALEQAIFVILNVERYKWLILPWWFGVELHSLIGKDPDYCIPEIERCITEALLEDDRITDVKDFDFEVKKKTVTTSFTVVSIYGEIYVEKEVTIDV